jgi:dienelactone hydrolase
MRLIAAFGCAAIAIGSWAMPARAKIIEEETELPVEVADSRGQLVRQPIKITIFRDDARARAPFLILNHGRAPYQWQRAGLNLRSFTANARYFAEKGFAVFLPLRIGYGATGGPDVEASGSCANRNYPPAYEAAAQQSRSVIAYAKSLPYVDPAKGIAVGQSFGGTTAIALSARPPSGLLAAINFAGGGGGNPETRPQDPCRNDLLVELFASYGASSKMPTLWLYSENDRFFGIEKPRTWFAAFTGKGGVGTFVVLPPHGSNGHASFTANPSAWRPAFEAFLRSCCGESFAYLTPTKAADAPEALEEVHRMLAPAR